MVLDSNCVTRRAEKISRMSCVTVFLTAHFSVNVAAVAELAELGVAELGAFDTIFVSTERDVV